jgi:hypothetical protein
MKNLNSKIDIDVSLVKMRNLFKKLSEIKDPQTHSDFKNLILKME